YDQFDEPIYDWLLEHELTPQGRIFNVGTGSGVLTIDGTILGDGLIEGDKVIVNAGTYSAVNIRNIDIESGLVEIDGNNVTVEDESTVQNCNGIDVHSINYTENFPKAITLAGSVTRARFHDLTFDDVY